MTPAQNASDPALSLLAGLIHEQTGLIYEPDRYDILLDKIKALAAECDCPTVLDYYYVLKYGESSGEEWQRLHTALAVNETYFWREFDQIRAVVEEIAPRLLRERPGKPLRIWHAACASGEEPYTMVMALREAGLDLPGQVEITATDFNPRALAQARSGEYRGRSFRSIRRELVEKYFTPLSGDRYRLVDEIRERVQFHQLNLLDQNGMDRMRGYDIILCRNVFIYFSDSAIHRVVESFYQALNPAGYLFVASAESLLRLTSLFELVEVGSAFAYRKTPAGNGKPPSMRLNDP